MTKITIVPGMAFWTLRSYGPIGWALAAGVAGLDDRG
jgi:hypothetical protein